MTASFTASRDLMRKFIRRGGLSVLLVGVILFGAAGTLNWPQAWVYLALTAAISFAGGFWLARHDPGLLAERLGSLIQPEQKGWDKLFMVAMLAPWTGWLVLMGLDAGRSLVPGSPCPSRRRLRAALPRVLSGMAYAQAEQLPGAARQDSEGAWAPCGDDRSLRLCASPHICWRSSVHRGRAAPARLMVGLAAGAGLVLVIAMRAVLEERTLMAELAGYADYAARVRYRLVPHLW